MNWNDIIENLEKRINWDVADHSEFTKVEDLLKEVVKTPNLIANRVYEIIENKILFKELQPHMESPRLFMDKFVLYIDPQDRFRIRLHSFKTTLQNKGAEQSIHDHRWGYSTIVLKGSYTEQVYSADKNYENMTAQLSTIERHELKVGQTNSLMPQIPHQTVNKSDDEVCVTLFVRGKSLFDANNVYDLESGKFRILKGLQSQLKVELENVVKLISN
jgi:quercetin dioxygenase-like cupin family protein